LTGFAVPSGGRKCLRWILISDIPWRAHKKAASEAIFRADTGASFSELERLMKDSRREISGVTVAASQFFTSPRLPSRRLWRAAQSSKKLMNIEARKTSTFGFVRAMRLRAFSLCEFSGLAFFVRWIKRQQIDEKQAPK
jgi:hypothetical protein